MRPTHIPLATNGTTELPAPTSRTNIHLDNRGIWVAQLKRKPARPPHHREIALIRLLLSLIIGAALAACARPHSVGQTGIESRQGDDALAVALELEVRRRSATNASAGMLWPGFDPLAIPLAVYDGEQTFLFRHPAPPQGFMRVTGAVPATYVWKGRHDAVTANTNAEVGGIPTATVLLERPQPGRSLVNLAAVAIHEAFHVYQHARHPGWTGNEADLFTYPTDSAELLALRRLETQALSEALGAADNAGAACWARQALALRTERYADMDPAFASYERGTELNEGLATYVEMRAAGRHSMDLPPGGFGPADVRRRAYASGAAFALLLDRFAPDWPAMFEANDDQTLDSALAVALGSGNTCTLSDTVVAGARQKARADVSALLEKRAERLAAFESRPGWRVVVESGGSEPLWPQGFDPLNVERVGAERVLHTRFLRLGNGAGRLEVLNTEALTEGAGSHPLFQGVRRVVVLTGLEEPDVSETGGEVRLLAPGLNLDFTGARVTRSGEVITVRVGS